MSKLLCTGSFFLGKLVVELCHAPIGIAMQTQNRPGMGKNGHSHIQPLANAYTCYHTNFSLPPPSNPPPLQLCSQYVRAPKTTSQSNPFSKILPNLHGLTQNHPKITIHHLNSHPFASSICAETLQHYSPHVWPSFGASQTSARPLFTNIVFPTPKRQPTTCRRHKVC